MDPAIELKENLIKLIEKYKVDPYEISILYGHKVEVWIENTDAYEKLQKLEALLLPTEKRKDRKVYEHLLLPFIYKDNSVKLATFTLVNLPKLEEYGIVSPTIINLIVTRGSNDVDKKLLNLIDLLYETARIRSKSDVKINDSDISPNFRVGKVKLKYVNEFKPIITREEAERVLMEYKLNRSRRLPSDEISLREYLNVVGLVYDALGLLDISKASVEDILKVRKEVGDFRDCGLLDLPLDDRYAFMKWKEENRCGLHPFEVVAGYSYNGILLYPPIKGRFAVYIDYIDERMYKIVCRLLEKKIPFTTDIKKLLYTLRGEIYVNVNIPTPEILGTVYYDDVKEKDKIIWKKIEEVKYR
ncbi:MAG: hypothetical protein RQ930_02040 [Candidatus Aenigmarchaeota archaeon]|nr:hypothetical protein [Candidatus Aenigmarchaeota archaeon]